MNHDELNELSENILLDQTTVDIESMVIKQKEFELESKKAEITWNASKNSDLKNEGQRSSFAKLSISNDPEILRLFEAIQKHQRSLDSAYRNMKNLQRKFKIYCS